MNKPMYGDEWLFGSAVEHEDVGKSCDGFMRPGRRNADLTSHAGLLRRMGLNKEEMEPVLNAINGSIASPLPRTEVKAIARSISRYAPGQDIAFDDVSSSREFAVYIEGRACFTQATGWMTFTSGRWSDEGAEERVEEMVKRFVETRLEAVKSIEPKVHDDILKAAKRCLSRAKVRNIKDLARSDPRVFRNYGDFDRLTDVLNVRNGTIEFGSGTVVFREHRAEDFLTKMADVDYVPDALCPTFDAVLAEALPKEEAEFFLRFFGYAASGRADQQVLGVFYGPGANGKSTLVNEIQGCLGPLAVNVETSTFMTQRSSSIRNDLARLAGTRLAVSTELGSGEILDAPLMKKITGGDTLTARFLQKENFEFVPTCVPVFVTNALPVIDGGDSAIVRRLVVLGFHNVIPADQRDTSLPAKLRAERSGVLNRILEGLLNYRAKGGLCPPASVLAETQDYAGNSDMFGQFLAEHTEPAIGKTVRASDLYSEYKSWAMQSGLKAYSMPQFKQALMRRPGFRCSRTKAGSVWHDLALKPDAWL